MILHYQIPNSLKSKAFEGSLPVLEKTLDFIRDILYRKRASAIYIYNKPALNPLLAGHSAMTLTTAIEMARWKNIGLGFEPVITVL